MKPKPCPSHRVENLQVLMAHLQDSLLTGANGGMLGEAAAPSGAAMQSRGTPGSTLRLH